MPVSHGHRVIFVHIPRTAGSSIEKALNIFGEENDGKNTYCPEKLYGLSGNIYLQHLTIFEIRDTIRKRVFECHTFDEYFKFTFIRNPFDRMFS